MKRSMLIGLLLLSVSAFAQHEATSRTGLMSTEVMRQRLQLLGFEQIEFLQPATVRSPGLLELTPLMRNRLSLSTPENFRVTKVTVRAVKEGRQHALQLDPLTGQVRELPR